MCICIEIFAPAGRVSPGACADKMRVRQTGIEMKKWVIQGGKTIVVIEMELCG